RDGLARRVVEIAEAVETGDLEMLAPGIRGAISHNLPAQSIGTRRADADRDAALRVALVLDADPAHAAADVLEVRMRDVGGLVTARGIGIIGLIQHREE